MSTTPRTDAAVQRHRLLGSGPFELEGRFADFARALETELAAMTLRAEKAEADTARLDWLLQDNVIRFEQSYSSRAAIDDAMKEASK